MKRSLRSVKERKSTAMEDFLYNEDNGKKSKLSVCTFLTVIFYDDVFFDNNTNQIRIKLGLS